MGERAIGHRRTWRHCRSFGTRYKTKSGWYSRCRGARAGEARNRNAFRGSGFSQIMSQTARLTPYPL
eukprot:5918273-Prymnesium_polylepis.1